MEAHTLRKTGSVFLRCLPFARPSFMRVLIHKWPIRWVATSGLFFSSLTWYFLLFPPERYSGDYTVVWDFLSPALELWTLVPRSQHRRGVERACTCSPSPPRALVLGVKSASRVCVCPLARAFLPPSSFHFICAAFWKPTPSLSSISAAGQVFPSPKQLIYK